MKDQQPSVTEKEFRAHFVQMQQYFLTLTWVLRNSYKIIERKHYDLPFPAPWDEINAVITNNFNRDEIHKHNGRALLGPYKSLESSIQALKLKVDALAVDKSESMAEMAFFSTFMCIYCWGLSLAKLPVIDSYLYTIDDYGHVVIKKSYELLGYWTAQFEIRQRNQGIASIRTDKKEAKKDKIRLMLDDYKPSDKKALQQLLRKAMQNIHGSENNIRDLIKEVISENAQ